MGRPKGTKNKKTVVVETQPPIDNEAIQPDGQVEAQPETPIVEPKKSKVEDYILVKTSNRNIVVKCNSLKFEVVHISGSGAVNNPKVFFIKILKSKLAPLLNDDEKNDVDDAETTEIDALIKNSKARGSKEYEASSARKKKLNGEIQPSEFYA